VRLHLGEGEPRHDSVHRRLAETLLGDLVAHAVRDPLAVDLRERLHHVGVAAEDQVHVR
jgi:hypothetical protein